MKKMVHLIVVSTKKLWNNCKLMFFLYALRTFISSMIPLVSVFFVKYITENLYPIFNLNNVIKYVLLMFFIEIILTFFNRLIVFIIDCKNEKIINKDKIDISTKFSKIFYQKTENSKFYDNYYQAIDFVDRGSVLHIINQMFLILTNLLTILGLVFLINEISIIAVLICLLIWFTRSFFDNKLNKKSHELYIKNLNLYRKNNYVIWNLADISNVKEHKLFKTNNFLSQKIDDSSKKILFTMRKENLIKSNYSVVQIFLNYILMAIIYLSMVFIFIKRNLPISDYSMLLAAFLNFGNTTYAIINSFLLIKKENIYFEKFEQIMTFYSETENNLKCPINVDTIEFKNVSYIYPNSQKKALDNLSIKIDFRKNKKISLVGQNGSGKSTFVKLLLKLYVPTNGEILINNVNIEHFNNEEYYELFSPVFQDFKIYSLSIVENIAFENDSVSEELKKMGLFDYINALEKKEFTNVTKIFDEDGIDFSGGERQKIAIARVLKKKSLITVLDEPTSELSAESENSLYEMIEKDCDNIIFFISHRLSSCRFTDTILVFDDGKIIERGNHEELLKNSQKYKSLVEHQASYYKKVDE